MIYVMSDIHGMYDDFIKMTNQIDLKSEDTLVIAGDVIDRGPDSIKLLKYIMSQENIIMMLGNHEHMMLEHFNGNVYAFHTWMANGGDATWPQIEKLDKEELQKILEFLVECRTYILVGKYFISHAGLVVPKGMNDSEISDIIKKQSIEDLLWTRDEFYMNKAVTDYVVIFGHSPVQYILAQRGTEASGPASIWHDRKFNDKICIDCGASSKHGRLACLRLNDMKEFYV